MTYDAVVTVAQPLTALMSAKCLPADPATPPSRFAAALAPRGTATFTFAQDVPIPAYLLALAVGELEARPLGPLSRVWAEPSVVDAAAYEFAQVCPAALWVTRFVELPRRAAALELPRRAAALEVAHAAQFCRTWSNLRTLSRSGLPIVIGATVP